MSIILEARPFGSSGECEFQLKRALSADERAQCEALANEQGAGWIEFYSFYERCIGNDPDWPDESSPMLHFIDPHPICIPEIRAFLESLA